MSQPQIFTLDDKEVCRRMALKATHDKVFERELLACANPDFVGRGSDDDYVSVSSAIMAIRIEMVEQARLRVPLLNGIPQDLSDYLKNVQNSRYLLGKAVYRKVDGAKVIVVERDREWGWVVSHQPCVQQHTI